MKDEYIKREDAMKALDEYRLSQTMSKHGDMEMLIEFRDGVVGAMNALAFVPTADVVPKSESLPLDVHEALKQRAVEKAKADVAREIFEKIERKVKASIVVHLEEINKEHIQDTPLYDRHSGIIFALRGMEDFIAELKKKYAEGATNELQST